MSRIRNMWEPWESDILKMYFPGRGVKWCAQRIPRHTQSSISKKVQELGLRLDVTASRIFTGAKKESWPTGIVRDRNGYMVQRIGRATQCLHRKVMAEYLGRPLTTLEIVHHKDRNKYNNEISNLEIITRAMHVNLHRDVVHRHKA